jgi:hypothetical protein
MNMKFNSTVFALLLGLGLVSPAQARSPTNTNPGWFYVTALFQQDNDNDGDAPLFDSNTFSTLTRCQTKSAMAHNLVQDCVPNCDPANPYSAWYLEEAMGDADADGNRKFEGFGPYGFQSDCEAGIADAISAGITSVLSQCVFIRMQRACGTLP